MILSVKKEQQTMSDETILHHIGDLVREEDALRDQAEQGDMTDTAKERLAALQVQLDQCWDLLRQRRARREFGGAPDDAQLRDPGTVEGYKQ
jgi:hypothetical protein